MVFIEGFGWPSPANITASLRQDGEKVTGSWQWQNLPGLWGLFESGGPVSGSVEIASGQTGFARFRAQFTGYDLGDEEDFVFDMTSTAEDGAAFSGTFMLSGSNAGTASFSRQR